MTINFRLDPDDIKTQNQDPLDLFYVGMKASETTRTMEGGLKRFLIDVCAEILSGSFRQRTKQFVDIARKDQERAVQIILAYTKHLKARTALSQDDVDYLNPSSVPNRIKPIKKLLDMNGIGLGWKRIYSTFPEENVTNHGRGYTREEIKQLLAFAEKISTQFIILASCSGGLRVGAWENMKWECVFPVYQQNEEYGVLPESADARIVCGAMIIYKGSKDEYIALISREAWDKLELYKKEWFDIMNREPKASDPLLLEKFKNPRPMTVNAIRERITKLIEKAKLQRHLVDGGRRYEVPATHGFRRFWDKVMMESARKSDKLSYLVKKERLLGHEGLVRTDKNYYWTDVLDLVPDYLIAMPELTINDEQRFKDALEAEKLKVAGLKKSSNEKDEALTKMEELEAKIERMQKYHITDQ